MKSRFIKRDESGESRNYLQSKTRTLRDELVMQQHYFVFSNSYSIFPSRNNFLPDFRNR